MCRLLVLVLAISSISEAAVTYKQSRAVDASGASPQTLTLAYTSNVTVGDALVIGCVSATPSTPTFLITDTQTNTYTSAVNVLVAAGISINIAYATAKTTGADTVSCKITNSGTLFTSLMIAEYSGLGTGTITDGSSSGTSGTTAGTCGTLTTTNANDLLFMVAASTSNSATWSVTGPPTGFTMRVADAGAGGAQNGTAGDKVVTAIQSAVALTYTVQNTDSATNACAAVGLKAAATFSPALLNQPLLEGLLWRPPLF
jgi:hypothetical protein